ncbi:MAG: hypothetical protein HW380_3829, partial [Magnetococcales bacterium]|nr:hypothetical protein [Magnetococcales bacterium]
PFTMNLDETDQRYQGQVVMIGARIDPAPVCHRPRPYPG